MQTAGNRFKAPADTPQKGISRLLFAFLTRLLWPVIECRHPRVTLPFNNRQTCLDCGSSRAYRFHANFEYADAGIFIGQWRKPAHSQTASRVAAHSAALSLKAVQG